MDEKIKLLFINRTMNFGGVESQLLDLLTGLDPDRFEMNLGLCEHSGAFLNRVPDYVKTYDLNYKVHLGLNPEMVPGIYKLIKKIKPQIIISFHSNTNIETFIAARLENKNNKVLGCFPGKITSGRLDWIRIPFFRQFNHLVCVGEGVAYSMRKSYGSLSNIMVIPNCVDINKVKQQSSEPTEHPWFKEKNIPVGVNVGRVVKSKNIATAIRSVVEINRTRPFRFLVIGDGTELENLKALAASLQAESYVDFLGYQENPVKFVAKSDYFIFTSDTEGLPTVLIEAMINKVPVISTPYINGKVEVVQNQINGILTSGWDPSEIAQKVIELMDYPDLRERLTQTAYDMSIKDFNKEAYIERYTNLFLKMLQSA